MTGKSRIDRIADFRSECLNNQRELFVYLPPSYDLQPDRTYPVLYVHDGQNVFNPAFNGQSWNLHQICDALIAEQRIEELIIVAIANMGMERNSEFAHHGPYEVRLDYPCFGESYENFLVEELKPCIDETYRTKRESCHTALMGSSRGGLVTYHIGFRRSDVFGKLAMISPYFAQYNEEEMKHCPIVQQFVKKEPLQLWIDTGGMEGMTVQVSHVREMVEHFIELGYRSGEDLMFCYEPLAEHNEDAWASRVLGPLIYFFGDKGLPVAAELIGDDIAAVNGVSSHVYPILTYESGLNIVDLDARFTLTPDNIAFITPEGLIMAWEVGDFVIEYMHPALSATKALSIVPALSPEVVVEIEVVVPIHTRKDAKIYAGVELEQVGQQTFHRRFTLPRGSGYSFHVCEYSGLQEADADGNAIPKRQFVANDDVMLRYEVESWIQGQTL
ncbi:hypothetical protein PAECIP111893_01074 [Paenibacillus plantiphilus]|uniref:Esterase n=1 Tax=Paenibacillus plantiphilus TaxID=2905650 RepID=A0ABN8G393_9BACL|nr:alpha/beta hydrolase-fold protein [Paenibacillus plantiphilus]CAH1197914.1 hypothetical protein PAECIP111893_01074 [Paenibacillus plantiphilus]